MVRGGGGERLPFGLGYICWPWHLHTLGTVAYTSNAPSVP